MSGKADQSAAAEAEAVAVARPVVERARIAVGIAFGVSGLAFASWISRTPAIRDGLELSNAQFGLLLLCLSIGAVSALPLSGPLVHAIGPRRTVLAGASAVTVGMLAVAAGVLLGVAPLAGAGLLLTGTGVSSWDVAMNVEGADVERRLDRPLMPRFHAGFSLGTVTGALAGAGCAWLGVPVDWQLAATALLVIGVIAGSVRWFLPVPAREEGTPASRSGVLRAWREPRTLLIGLLVLAFAFTEGVANDWLTLAVVDGYGTNDAVGAVVFGLFVTAMTGARMVGGSALQRWGRVLVLRCTALLALVGLLLVVFGPALPWALVGALLWGAGASLGFPVGMSAAADVADRAAVRVSVVSSIGYTAFLAGPPLVGFLAERDGILRALLVVLGALVIGLLVAGATAPPRPNPTAPPRPNPASRSPHEQSGSDPWSSTSTAATER
ncbi:MFS transporter [Solwaraspora sp. WMMD406]|uniref:MFS transporter n=1 Tax=Solwaraspora sp. WMMD406 TaxID=3016095 RepID=UPI0024179926|nr:MFS transporter [Solwaraspora sp. WMMD406]MDG4767804.1 MFS transporter [Solwaraspora sp. WMMD406]